jgi:TonB family protein
VATAPTGEGIPLRLGAGGTGGGQGTGSPSLLLTPQAALRLTDPTRGPDGDQPRALQAPDLRLAPFLQRAHQSLQGHWRPAATLDQRFANRQVEQSGESESTVAVTINRSGSVLEVKLVGRSAHDFLDELALTTLRTARAFAHPPQALFGSQDSFRFLVTFRVRVILPVDRPEPYDPLLPPQAKELFRNPVFAALQQALQPIQEPTEYLTRKSLRDTPYPMCLRHEVGCRQGCAWDHLVFQAVYEPCAYAR